MDNLTWQPSCYLSKNSALWQVIVKGSPICAPTSLEQAKLVAARFSLDLPSVYWDSLSGSFLQEIIDT